MRVAGRRTDGALFLNVGAGMACILKGKRVSPVVDLSVIAAMGPWAVAEDQRSFDARRMVQARADLAVVGPLGEFTLLDLTMSFDEQRERVTSALRTKLGLPASGMYAPYSMDFYIPQNGMGDDWVVYAMQGKYFGLPYAIDDTGAVSFDGQPVEVHQTWESLDEDDQTFAASSTPIELKQSAWFKKFMANKKKNLAKTKVNAADTSASLPNVKTTPSSV